MKKLSVHFLVLASFIVTSCNEFMEERNTNPNEVETICAKIKGFEYDTDDFSRTFISIEQDGPHYAWAVTDTIGIFPSEGRQVEFSMASGAGSASAVFTGGGWGLKSTSTYAAYFPLIGQYYLDKTDIPVHYTGQVQEGNASTAHLGVYDYLAAPASEVKNGGVSFDFERLGCLVQIQLTMPSPTTIYSVTLKAENDAFAVKGKVDLTESSPRIYPVASSSELMLEVKNVTTAKANQVATFYMMLPPTDLSGKTLKAVVSVENGSKEVSLASKNFQAGKAYALSATLGDDWISETDYVDLKFGMTGVVTSYNTGNGSLSITYPSGSLPNVKVGNATVLPAEYGFDIRVIESVNTSGNTISMQTSQGNMSNLFRNTSFTLTTDASATRSAEDNVYTPTAYGYVDEDGKYHEVYNIENGTRAVYPIEQFKWGFERDYKGEVIYSGKAGTLSWDECKFSAGLKGTFTFDFGMKQISEARAVGDLKKIEYKITGNLDMDMLLHYNYEYEYKESGDEIIQYNAIPMGQFTFRVPIGGVPVPVHLQIYTHLGRMYACHIEGKLDATTGVKMSNEVSIGLEWTPENGAKPIREIKPTFEFHPLTVEAEASAEAKVSYYPQWEIGLYRFKAIWLEPRPYLKEKVEAGFRASTDGNNYIGWKAETYNGMDIRMGLETEFGFWRKDVWTSDIYNIKDSLLFEAPSRIRTLSPENGINIGNGESVEVEFIVESFSPLTNKYYPCPFALVIFEPECGELDKKVAITDAEGKLSVNWTPNPQDDKPELPQTISTKECMLIAKVVNKEGESIDEASLFINAESNGNDGGGNIESGNEDEEGDSEGNGNDGNNGNGGSGGENPEQDSPLKELREALIKLYESTNGDNWLRNRDWCSDAPLDSWQGVSITNGNEVHLLLSQNNLTGKIEQTFPEGFNITLRCDFNHLTSINVANSTSLQDLRFEGNPLSSLDISGCSSIKSLSNVLISSQTPLNINGAGCSALEYVDFGDNQFGGSLNINLSRCSALDYVYFGDNQFGGSLNIDLSGCSALKELNMSNNQIEDFFDLDLSGCSSFEHLVLERNNIESFNLETKDCFAVEYFTFSQNQFGTLTLNLSGCPNLTDFQISEEITKKLCIDANGCNVPLSDITINSQIESIDISGGINKLSLRATYADLVNISTSGGEMSVLSLGGKGSNINTVNVVECSNIKNIGCGGQITSLNIEGCENLISVLCSDIHLASLDINGCYNLETLHCSQNDQLTSLNLDELKKCEKLSSFACYQNKKFKSAVPKWLWERRYTINYILDWRYEYDSRYENGYKDKGYGWWYPGEPEKGYSGM